MVNIQDTVVSERKYEVWFVYVQCPLLFRSIGIIRKVYKNNNEFNILQQMGLSSGFRIKRNGNCNTGTKSLKEMLGRLKRN